MIERQRKSNEPSAGRSSKSEAPNYYGDDESEGLLDKCHRDEQGEKFYQHDIDSDFEPSSMQPKIQNIFCDPMLLQFLCKIFAIVLPSSFAMLLSQMNYLINLFVARECADKT